MNQHKSASSEPVNTKAILEQVNTIALVGASHKSVRPSYQVMQFLQSKGYRVIPVNVGLAGQTLLGEEVYADLAAIPVPVDMVDVFRASQYVSEIVEQTLALPTLPKVLWLQLGVTDEMAESKAKAAGLITVSNHCPKIEYEKFFD